MIFHKFFCRYRFLISIFMVIILLVSFRNFKSTSSSDIDVDRFKQIVAIQDQEMTRTRSAYADIDVEIDKRNKDLSEFLEEASSKLRNFPPQPYMLYGKAPILNKTCAPFPTLFNIEFDNEWQILKTPNGTVYFYGAYYDKRNLTAVLSETLEPAVRILGMIDWKLQYDNTTTYYCQLWFESEKGPVFSQVLDQKYIFKYGRGKLQIFLFTCLIPEPYKEIVPTSVSIVVNQCNRATNNLKVLYEDTTEKRDFAVCAKGLDFLHQDHSVRLVEWIELLRILGTDKIFLYELAEHPNSSKVLRYYENTNYVEVTPLTLPGGLPNDPRLRHIYLKRKINDKRANELIPYNDCFYRNMYKYKYIALLDSDETIVPLNVLSWKEMVSSLEARYPENFDIFSSMCFRNIHFFENLMQNHSKFPDIPKFMHQLQHVYRLPRHSGKGAATKCFHNTERVISLHNHFPVHCFGKCRNLFVDPNDAQMQHYQSGCKGVFKNCTVNLNGEEPVLDNNLWRFKDNLINRTLHVLNEIGFLKNSWKRGWWSHFSRLDISNVFKS